MQYRFVAACLCLAAVISPGETAAPSAERPIEVDEVFRTADDQKRADKDFVGAKATARLASRVILRKPQWITHYRGVIVHLVVPDNPKWDQDAGGEPAGVLATGVITALSLSERTLTLECRSQDILITLIE